MAARTDPTVLDDCFHLLIQLTNYFILVQMFIMNISNASAALLICV